MNLGNMKTRLVLMLLLCGACYSCNAPQQDKQESDLTNVNMNMTNERLREKLALALEDMKAKAIEMGSWVLELHQIDENPSTFREFINKHGNGVHHLGFEVGDTRDEVIRELKEMGFDTERTIGVYPGSSWTIVDSEDVLGVNLNIKPKR